ncbi:MAG: ATP-binding protein [Saprospiraceae bacterium]|nr:ATP-binding protein [Saprospiraceae bacterium]
MAGKEELLKNHPEYKIVVEIENLPEDENELLIVGNESLLKTAFKNLMDNGCKYSMDKLVELRMKYQEKNVFAVDIENRGTGITSDEAIHIFKPFYRSPQHASINGFGIGLSLVHQILDLHKVKISIDQSFENKTRFRLIFDSSQRQSQSLVNINFN